MKYKNTSRRFFGPKKALLLLLIIVVVGAGIFWLIQKKHDNKKPVLQPGSVADVSRPTQEEQQAADTQKTKNLERAQADQTAPATPTSKKQVTPFITYLEQTNGNVEVGGIITGIYEDGGTCTITATNGSYKITRQSDARKNASTTDCVPFSIPVTAFTPKGTWSFVLSYSSSDALGSSQSKDISVK